MAKAVALIASALCLLAVIASAAQPNAEVFHVEGSVYCDTCRVQFETPLVRSLSGAKVELKCRDPVTEAVKYETSVVTDATGAYRIGVVGDHEDEICEVSVVESPDETCKEKMEGLNSARINLALNDGIHESTRFANPLGFMTKEALPGCKQVLEDMGFVPLDQNQI